MRHAWPSLLNWNRSLPAVAPLPPKFSPQLARMTKYAKSNNTPLAIKGDAKELVKTTSWLLATPAPVATNPFTRVARPKIVERSVEGMASAPAEVTSHDSKTE
jgi:hypothetical protein